MLFWKELTTVWMFTMLEKITKSLNPPQREAVQQLEGPVLILAGAGSGKTRVLTHRMAYSIATGFAGPEEILAVTFTNKAAKEMEHRIFGVLMDLGIPVHSQLWISTFHAFCTRVLREHITLLDYKPFFGIYDSADQLSLIKKIMNALNINDKMFPAKNFQARINGAKMLALYPDDIERKSKHMMDQKTLEVYRHYEDAMKKSNSLDFGDLLLKVYDLFKMYPDILEMYQNKFKLIMIDEYQDTNRIQYLLVHILASKHKNICVVGDEDQSIYSWRGADISNILDFEKDYPNCKVIKLEENYRSSGNIVDAATKLIQKNSERKDKTLFTSNPKGDLITAREEKSEYDEARFVAKEIEKLLSTGAQLQDFAIFYRTNAQSRVLEEQLRTHSIPYKIVGGIRFYERMEIKDILSYMKVAININDDIALKRIINTPARGIGKTTIDQLEEISNSKKISLYESIEEAVNTRAFNAGTCGKLRRFYDLIQTLSGQALQYNLLDFYSIVLESTEYLLKLKTDESPEAQSRIENLEELQNAISQFCNERGDDGTLQSFLEEMALVSDIDSLDTSNNSVTMMTLHISKGLEYPYVFIVGLEENLFPSAQAQGDETEKSIEEERRLAYVGITRARQKLYLTHARQRRVWGQEQFNPPSRFIHEIPRQYIEFQSNIEAPKSFASRYGSDSSSSFGQTSSFGKAPQKYPHYNASMNDESQEFPDYESGSSMDNGFQKGMKVRHPTFGPGSIFQTEGSGEQQKVSVIFADNTVKKFIAKYARLERI
jgi:DNA helicase-2/ATP-dependent DNA helicase PcrA